MQWDVLNKCPTPTHCLSHRKVSSLVHTRPSRYLHSFASPSTCPSASLCRRVQANLKEKKGIALTVSRHEFTQCKDLVTAASECKCLHLPGPTLRRSVHYHLQGPALTTKNEIFHVAIKMRICEGGGGGIGHNMARWQWQVPFDQCIAQPTTRKYGAATKLLRYGQSCFHFPFTITWA